jgi:hypothetical protein
LGIAALGIAIVYLIVIAAGAVLALLALVWLFGEAPGESAGTGHEIVEGSSGRDRFAAARTGAASVEPERSEGKAA